MSNAVIIAGGGTGGHVYPALAIAQALQKQDSKLHIYFVGTKQGHESRIIKEFPIFFLPVSGLNQMSVLQKILTLIKIPLAFILSVYILLKIRPKYVLGVGGYASGPFVLVAALLGFKTALFESNAIPGITNRWLSRFVGVCMTLFEESKKYFKSENIILTGFPVRSVMGPSPQREGAKMRVLIFGGSQGARGINSTVSEALSLYKKELASIEFVHQTGKLDYSTISSRYKDHVNVTCLEYLDPIKKYYDWADVIFCRAGASTLSELAVCGKAAVLIPFPFAADNHQQKNAESLVEKQAAQMILQKEFTPEVFKKKVLEFAGDKSLIAMYEQNIQRLYKPGAAETIANIILEG